MNPHPCDALHEIQEGRLNIGAFLPGQVYESGLFERFHVTISDLRQHRFGCDACAALDRPWIQLESLDRKAFELVSRWIHEALENLRGSLEDAACLAASDDEESFWIMFESEMNQAYSDLIQSQVLLGSFLKELFGTVLPYTVLAFVADIREGRVGIEPGLDMNQTGFLPSPVFQELVMGKDENLVMAILRAALLWRGFGGYMTGINVKSWAASGGNYSSTAPKETRDDISWSDVWRDYSSLAEFEARRILAASSSEIVPKTDHNLTNLSDGQTAIMGMLLDFEQGIQEILETQRRTAAAAQHLLDAYRRAPADTKERCKATVRDSLGSRYDEISEQSRLFLLTAEYSYEQGSPDLDWSTVIVSLKKAFETQLKIVLAPFWNEIESTISASQKPRKPLRKSNLGDIASIFRESKFEIELILKDKGLSYKAMWEAITLVNRHTDAKHDGVKGMADATTFRSLFIGTHSVMCALFP